MREGDDLSPYRKKLFREANQYFNDSHTPIVLSPEFIEDNYSEDGAKKLIQEGRIEEMYENISKPKNIGRVGSIRMGRDIGRKKKSSKAKPKRKIVKKTKGCGCK